jgi:hypothetical protein
MTNPFCFWKNHVQINFRCMKIEELVLVNFNPGLINPKRPFNGVPFKYQIVTSGKNPY